MSQNHPTSLFVLSLKDLPPSGRNLTVTEQEIWQEQINEFQINCHIEDPLAADLLILPMEGGVLVRGTITGCLHIPCDRCCEPTTIALHHDFEDFESLQDDPLEESRIYSDHGVPMLDVAAICWEEFVLALPSNPLCKPDCRGLCPKCGANLNEGDCACNKEQMDPRMALFRKLKLG